MTKNQHIAAKLAEVQALKPELASKSESLRSVLAQHAAHAEQEQRLLAADRERLTAEAVERLHAAEAVRDAAIADLEKRHAAEHIDDGCRLEFAREQVGKQPKPPRKIPVGANQQRVRHFEQLQALRNLHEGKIARLRAEVSRAERLTLAERETMYRSAVVELETKLAAAQREIVDLTNAQTEAEAEEARSKVEAKAARRARFEELKSLEAEFAST